MTDAADAGRVVVVGAGLGGLITGILLSRLGLGVAVVEANAQAGGLIRSYRRQGTDCPLGIHYIGAAAPGQILWRVFGALGIREQVPLVPAGTEGMLSRYHFGDESFELPVGFEPLEARLLEHAPDEAPAIRGFMASLREAVNLLELRPSGLPEGGLFLSAREHMERLGCSPRLIRLLSGPEAWVGMRIADCPRMIYETALASYMLSSWRLGVTGAKMADVCADALQAFGGELILNDGAKELLLADHAVRGVRLRSGRTLLARRVVVSAHPKTMLGWLPDAAPAGELKERIERLADTPSAGMAFGLVDAARVPVLDHNTYLFGEHRRTWFQVRPTERKDKNLLAVIRVEPFEPWQRWAETTLGHRGQDYLDAKARLAESMLEEIRRVAQMPNPEWLDVLTPLSFRDWIQSPLGSIYGLARGGVQFAGLGRPGLTGLHFAGQSAVAPGVVGVALSAVRVCGMIGGRRAIASLLEA